MWSHKRLPDGLLLMSLADCWYGIILTLHSNDARQWEYFDYPTLCAVAGFRLFILFLHECLQHFAGVSCCQRGLLTSCSPALQRLGCVKWEFSGAQEQCRRDASPNDSYWTQRDWHQGTSGWKRVVLTTEPWMLSSTVCWKCEQLMTYFEP